MSTRPDHERSISEWLVAQASDRAPDRLLEASRERIRTTRQRRVWWPAIRIPAMNTAFGLAAAAAAVAVVAFIGYQLVVGSSPPGGPAPGPSEAPSATPAPTPGVTDYTTYPTGTNLVPGPYVIDYAAPEEVILHIPALLDQSTISVWEKADYDWGPWHTSNGARLGVALVENLYVDPCDPSRALRYPAVGPTEDDLATALQSVPGLVFTGTLDAGFPGYASQGLEFTGEEHHADCIDTPLVWTTTRGDPSLVLPEAGDRVRVWIVDARRSPSPDAGNRLVVWAAEDQGFDAQEDMEYLLGTIRIYASE